MTLAILYTAGLRADFALMPRVFTTIQQVRRRFDANLLIDLGHAWSADSWVCQATANRAPYVVLDAMGYAVARADGLTAADRVGLQEAIALRLLDVKATFRWTWRAYALVVGPGGDVSWPVADALPGSLILDPPEGALGCVEVAWPEMRVVRTEQILFSGRPDPTIVAAVEFVEREARSYAYKKRGAS